MSQDVHLFGEVLHLAVISKFSSLSLNWVCSKQFQCLGFGIVRGKKKITGLKGKLILEFFTLSLDLLLEKSGHVDIMYIIMIINNKVICEAWIYHLPIANIKLVMCPSLKQTLGLLCLLTQLNPCWIADLHFACSTWHQFYALVFLPEYVVLLTIQHKKENGLPYSSQTAHQFLSFNAPSNFDCNQSHPSHSQSRSSLPLS